MFTPNRTPLGSTSGRRRATPSSLGVTPRRTRTPVSSFSSRRSNFYMRSSPADVSLVGSPSVSAYSTDNYAIEVSGSSLPVLVTEALSLDRDKGLVSAVFNENGWAWLVSGRRLFVWKFKQGTSKHLCKEFTLSSSESLDSQCDAGLIWVGPGPVARDDGAVSLLVLSRKGKVKYWPNIILSTTSSYETSLDGINWYSDNEACIKVVMIKGIGYLACSSKGALFHLQTSYNSVSCNKLQVSHGMLAGIGRRVSSFFFSSGPDVNVVNFALLHLSPRSSPEIILLTTSSLQRWQLSSVGPRSGSDLMTAQFDVTELLNEPVSKALWNAPSKQFEIWPLDVAICSKNNHIAILIACEDGSSSRNRSLRMCLCICPATVLKVGQSSTVISSQIDVIVIDDVENMEEEETCETFQYQLLIPSDTGVLAEQAIIWRSNKVIIKSLSKGLPSHEDILPLSTAGDVLLGAGRYNDQGILLTSSSGLLNINPIASARKIVSQNIEDSILQTPSSRSQTPVNSVPNTPLFSKARMEQLESSEDGAQRLQAAFIHFNRLNTTQAKQILLEAFGGADGKKSLNDAVVFVSQELINDFPTQDPRWAESAPQDSANSSTSLIIQHQLQDKQKAHQLFLDFLTEVEIWDSLGISVDSKTKQKFSTRWVLIEHGEKLASAIALRQKHSEHQGIVDSAIRKVLEKRGTITDRRGLTPQDIFYREVSRIQDILEGILDKEEDMICDSTYTSREIFAAIAGANEVFQAMLSAAHSFRRSKDTVYHGKNLEFSPWTVSSGRQNLRGILLRQQEITSSQGLQEAEDGQQRALLYAHLVVLADLLLTGYQQQIRSVMDDPSFSARHDEIMESLKRHRTAVITPILNAGMIDKAANLAEKYHDFGILVELCDRNDDHNRLSQYMIEFRNLGFSDFLFNWFLEKGKFRKLLECATSGTLASADYNVMLSEFLSSHPKINWLHQIKIGDFMSAHETLQYLAKSENRSAIKKNHYLSLSKLSAVFSNQPDHEVEQGLKDVIDQQIILKHQETLPDAVLKKLGLTLENMPVFTVQKLIELYVGEDNSESNEIDFKKALDLLHFVPCNRDDESMDEEEAPENVSTLEELKLLIWTKAILKDMWDDINHGSDALEASNHTILSKTLDLAYHAGVLADCMPDVDELLNQELLESIKSSASTQYLIRAKFEQYQRQLIAT